MPNWTVRAAGKSVTGNYRPKNEDRSFVDAAGHVYIVADGMGGQQAGEKASEMAVEHLSTALTRDADLAAVPGALLVTQIQQAVVETNAEIMALSQLDYRFHSMGTTVVLAVFAGRYAYVTGAGDSRAYLVRGRKIQQLTRDHSVAESLAEAGAISREEVREHRYRHMLWKYLGTKEASSRPDVHKVRLRHGDRLLLASDGLTGVVPDEQIRATLTEHDEPQAAVDALIHQALNNDSHDNVTCVAVYVD
jgi:serine/threonine protein phosphatase PrpC